jgi:hypothetical protein
LVVINMYHINALVFTLALATRDIGAFMIITFIWYSIAMSLKLEFEIAGFSHEHSARTSHPIEVEGAIINVSTPSDPAGELAVGMSMGEP